MGFPQKEGMDMSVIHMLVDPVPLPKMALISQRFPDPHLTDLAAEVQAAFAKEDEKVTWPVGKEVAVIVGSRGIACIDEVTKHVIEVLKAKGVSPFIVPGMGSHGGATGPGQKEVLASLGVTEERMGVPIRASMEVVQIGELANGLPVYVDQYAYSADGIVLINRVKPHTAFRGRYESGIVKMMAIGLGKQKGAESCHKLGFGKMADHIVQIADVVMKSGKILCGVAIVENAYDHVMRVEVLPTNEIFAREPAILELAKASMPRILVDDIDVLVVDEIGKDISGDGMDPNITGRYPTPYATGGPNVTKISVLGLTERTHGNANGLGVADTTTRQTFDSIDFEKTYPNALTSTVIAPVRLPMVMDTDKMAIQAAIKTCNILKEENARVVHIQTTLAMNRIRVSELLLPLLSQRKDIEVISEPKEWPFSPSGRLDFAACWRE
jgi:hypothetical protein